MRTSGVIDIRFWRALYYLGICGLVVTALLVIIVWFVAWPSRPSTAFLLMAGGSSLIMAIQTLRFRQELKHKQPTVKKLP